MILENAPVFNAASSGLTAFFPVNFSTDLQHTLFVDGTWQGDRKHAASLYIDNYNNNFGLTITIGASSIRCPSYSQGYVNVASADRVVLTSEGSATVNMTLYTDAKPEGFTARGNPPAANTVNMGTYCLFHMDGFNGQNLDVDAKAGVILGMQGGGSLSTIQKKFGTTSGRLPSSGRWSTNETYKFTQGFTIEGFYYLEILNAGIQPMCLFECGGIGIALTDTGIPYVYDRVAGVTTPAVAVALTTGSWNHIALCGIGGRVQLYVNGAIRIASTALAFGGASGVGFVSGGLANGSFGTTHALYVDEMRVSGSAIYLDTFVAPSAPFTG